MLNTYVSDPLLDHVRSGHYRVVNYRVDKKASDTKNLIAASRGNSRWQIYTSANTTATTTFLSATFFLLITWCTWGINDTLIRIRDAFSLDYLAFLDDSSKSLDEKFFVHGYR